VLSAVYPDDKWDSSMFQSVKKYGDLVSTNNQRKVFDSIAIKLKIQKMEDWYSVTANDIKQNGGSTILNYYNNSLRKGANLLGVSTRFTVI
jgi:hypothetical protein